MDAARRFLWVGRASSFCLAILAVPSSALADGLYFRLDVGALAEHSSYTRNDETLGNRVFPSPSLFAKRTVTAIGAGPTLRADLGWAIRPDVVLALSAEGSYVGSLSSSGSFDGRTPQGWLRIGLGPSAIVRVAPKVTVRFGCAYVAAQGTGSGDLVSYGPDDTYMPETLTGVALHGGVAWDLFLSKHVGLGPALRLDLARLSSGRIDGASTLTIASLSLTFGVFFR